MLESDVRRFRANWRALARRGGCDTIDGAEYQRVLSEWAQNGCPVAVAKFIAERANRRAPSPDEGIDLGRPPA